MRIPRIINYTGIEENTKVELHNMEFSKPVYIFYNDKSRIKFIKRVEKIVRSSLEYRELIAYLRSALDMNYCMFFNNVSKDKAKRVGIEIHHLPFGLFDITKIVLKKYEVNELPIDPYVIAEEVIQLHYKGMVGLVPLSSTVHELYHRGDIFIPLQYVDKGYLLFYREYHEYMDDYTEMLERLIKMSKEYNPDVSNNILKRKLILIDNDYSSTPNHLE